GLQLDPQGQLRRIERKAVLRDGLIDVEVATAGGPQTMPALVLDVLPGFLFLVDENRAKEEARPDIILFQRECAKVLADHFIRKHPPALPALADTTAATIIIEQIADLTGVINLLREHLEALLTLPGQVADLSIQVGETRVLVESLATRQDSTDARLEAVDTRTQRLSPAHTRTVQEQVDRMVRETKRLPTPLTYATIYGRLKHRFRVGSYKEVADSRFDELMAYLRDELGRATSGEAAEQSSLF
ncbi:MAG TPA: phage antirepressor N-terminal domain-containing protein, partial [Ktedonobacterales bacterium]|nr:phage antirepressor N-terminal domain-containing protein [Ktedonobacterales bacterium]